MKRNVTASIRARLQNRAKVDGRPFQELLQYYGLERFLYRLANSAHRESFILKGALMLHVWEAETTRATRDIDFLAFANNDLTALRDTMLEICHVDGNEDGIVFDLESLTAVRIKEDADYEGARIKFMGYLDKARIPMQIDIGFGDVMHPKPTEAIYPPLLDEAGPTLRVYPRETVIAEKFEAMVHLGTLNSRMKDFYDVWLLSRIFDFEGSVLSKAIAGTFANRKTEIESEPIAFTPDFYEAEHKQKQWAAFVRKSGLAEAPSLTEAIEQVKQFLSPVARALGAGEAFDASWQAIGPWT